MKNQSDLPITSSAAKSNSEHSPLADCESFLRGAAYSLVQESYEGGRQLLQHSNIDIRKCQLVAEPSPLNEFAKAGSMVESVAEFFLVYKTIGKLTGLDRLSVTSKWSIESLKMGLSGAAIAVASPISEDNQFGKRKEAEIANAFSSMAVFGAVVGTANELGILGRASLRSYQSDTIVYGASGAISGLASSELQSLILNHRAANQKEISAAVAENMSLGFGFASFDHLIGANAIKFKIDPTGPSATKLTTEDWAANHYDGTIEIRSPILTWLAENKPQIRPSNYAELRVKAFADKGPINLSVSDWAPEQRPTLIKELRRLSHKKLATDSNIDAFISRIAAPQVQELAAGYATSLEPLKRARSAVQLEISRHPDLADKRPLNFLYGIERVPDLPCYSALREKVQSWSILDRSEYTSPAKSELKNALQSKFDELTIEAKLPAVFIEVSPTASGTQIGKVLWLGVGETPAISALTLERAYHEFNHHGQGLDTKAFFLMYPRHVFYKIGKRFGLKDPNPCYQSWKNADEYFNKYVGSSREKQAWASGLLTRMRALSAGLPMGD